MKRRPAVDNRELIIRITAVVIGIIINVLMSYVVYVFQLPVFLDSIGTIAVAALGGAFPGIVTGVMTNAICTGFNEVAIYFGIVNAIIAIYVAWYSRTYPKRTVKDVVFLILGAGLISGTISAFIQWKLYLGPQSEFVANSIDGLAAAAGVPVFITFLFVNILFDILDKAITVVVALNIIFFVPEKIRLFIINSGWKQRPLTDDEMRRIRKWAKKGTHSMRARLTIVLFGASVLLIGMMSIVGMRLYVEELGAVATPEYIATYLSKFMWRILLIMSGILLVILAYGLWNTATYMVYPISSITIAVENFIQAGDDQKKLDKAIRELRSLNIHTDDEVERLYYAICNMASNQAEQMRSIRRFSDSTAKMQDGLIVTMADLVEKRDSSTGSHIQKTAAYVKIIVEGLKKKGYYAGKVNSKFVSDVIRSAPLHDIGKIHIPDSVLNKAGELTDEEYEIIKAHTTAGMKIMENAISTVSGENYLKEARNMAAYHHERWDGTGYPEGLHGEVIPLSARIMAVADKFDALTSERVYMKPISFEEAVLMIQEGSGTEFDPKRVEVFTEALPEVKVVYRKYNKNF